MISDNPGIFLSKWWFKMHWRIWHDHIRLCCFNQFSASSNAKFLKKVMVLVIFDESSEVLLHQQNIVFKKISRFSYFCVSMLEIHCYFVNESENYMLDTVDLMAYISLLSMHSLKATGFSLVKLFKHLRVTKCNIMELSLI